MSWLFALIDIALKLMGLKPKQDATQALAQVANTEGQASAQIGRQTSADTTKELADAQTQTAASVAAVHDADGLRGVSDAVNDAINRANSAGGV